MEAHAGPPPSPPRSVTLLVLLSLVCLAVGVVMTIYAAAELGERPEEAAVRATGGPAVAPAPAAPIPPKPTGIPAPVLVRLFHKLLYEAETWKGMSWLGVRTLQNPADMWVLQELIFELEPDFIIETGTFHGGSCVLFAMVLDQMDGDGKILTIDVEPRVREAQQFRAFRERVEVLTGGSTDPELVARIAERVKGKKVMVLLDSDHRKEHVLRELELYGPLVSEGSYLIVEDTNLNGNPVVEHYGPGPREAVADFLKSHPEFQIDRSREKFLVSFYPEGWLKRVGSAPAAPAAPAPPAAPAAPAEEGSGGE